MATKTYTVSINDNAICCATWHDSKWMCVMTCREAVGTIGNQITKGYTALIADHDMTDFCMTGEGEFDPIMECAYENLDVDDATTEAMIDCFNHCEAEFSKWY